MASGSSGPLTSQLLPTLPLTRPELVVSGTAPRAVTFLEDRRARTQAPRSLAKCYMFITVPLAPPAELLVSSHGHSAARDRVRGTQPAPLTPRRRGWFRAGRLCLALTWLRPETILPLWRSDRVPAVCLRNGMAHPSPARSPLSLTPTLQMKGYRLREVKELARGNAASQMVVGLGSQPAPPFSS